MNELIQRLSSYNLFNYLFPGVVFAILLKWCTGINLIVDDVVQGMFFYYFLGLVLSRIGSLLIEPALKKVGLIKFSSYKDFVEASKCDGKIDLLSEVNNTYRTIITMLVVLLGIMLGQVLIPILPTKRCLLIGCILALIMLFIWAYRKQSTFIKKRVNIALKANEEHEKISQE